MRLKQVNHQPYSPHLANEEREKAGKEVMAVHVFLEDRAPVTRCPFCGSLLPEGDGNCGACGTSFDSPSDGQPVRLIPGDLAQQAANLHLVAVIVARNHSGNN